MLHENNAEVACMYVYGPREIAVPDFCSFLTLQSRFGDTPLKAQVVGPQFSPQRDCRPKRVNDVDGIDDKGEPFAHHQSSGEAHHHESVAYRKWFRNCSHHPTLAGTGP